MHSSKSASNIVAGRAAAEGQLHTMRAEEEQQKAHLSEMLQVLSGEVRAARAEVEELRAGEGGSADGRRSQPQQQDALSDDESETTMSREPPKHSFAACSISLTPRLCVPPGPDGSSVSSGSSDSFDGTSTGYGTSTAQSTGVSTSRRGGSSDDSTELTTARSSTTGGASGLPNSDPTSR